MDRSVDPAFIVKVPVPVDAVSLTWRRWKSSDEKVELRQNFNGKVNSDHEAAVKSVQELGLKLSDTAESGF